MIEIPYLNEYLNHMEKINLASKYTLKNYPIHLRDFFNFTKGKYNVTTPTISKYTMHLLEERKFARTTVNAKLSCLRSYFHFLYNEEIIDRNIAEKIQLLEEEEKEPRKIMAQEKIFKILDEINDVRDRALLETLYSTGVREGEMVGLNIEHIDFKNELITVLKGKGKNGGKTRVIPISKTALKWIKAYITSRKTGPVFVNNRCTRLSERSVYTIVKKYFPFSPHELRHAFASHLIKKTGNIKGVSLMLGHSSAQMTEKIYTHLNPEDLQDIHKEGGMDR